MLFKNTLIGRMCAEREITKDSPMPLACFCCAAHRAHEAATASTGTGTRTSTRSSTRKRRGKPKPKPAKAGRLYYTWEAFKRHMRRCQHGPTAKPICHFCEKPIAAVGRPAQMARHMLGEQGNAACKSLQKVLRGGVTTYGDLADWLKQKQLAIMPEFLGKVLADKLSLAAREKDPVGRDVKLDIPLLAEEEKQLRRRKVAGKPVRRPRTKAA